MKKNYLLAWILVAASIAATTLTGNYSPINIIALSFITFTLIFGFVFWLFINKLTGTKKYLKPKINLYKREL